jgi:hypothetical protein
MEECGEQFLSILVCCQEECKRLIGGRNSLIFTKREDMLKLRMNVVLNKTINPGEEYGP